MIRRSPLLHSVARVSLLAASILISACGGGGGSSSDSASTLTAPQTGSVVLNWTAPVARADGSALAMSEITGYAVYYGKSAGNYPNARDINDGSDTSVTITNLPPATYYMVVTTRDSGGRESSYSSEVVKVVN